MGNLAIGLGAGAFTFLFGYAGMLLQKRLPEAHMTSGARDMIGAVMGLIALLLALVLGTLGRLGLWLLRRAEGQYRDDGGAGDPTRHGVPPIRPRGGAAAGRHAGSVVAGL